MPFLLALLAVVAMVSNPAIAAPKADCNDRAPTAASSMSMPGTASRNVTTQKHTAMPCCDPGAGKKPMSSRDCSQACAAMASVAVVTTPQDQGALVGFRLARSAASASDRLRAHEPGRLDRPPKHIA